MSAGFSFCRPLPITQTTGILSRQMENARTYLVSRHSFILWFKMTLFCGLKISLKATNGDELRLKCDPSGGCNQQHIFRSIDMLEQVESVGNDIKPF